MRKGLLHTSTEYVQKDLWFFSLIYLVLVLLDLRINGRISFKLSFMGPVVHEL